MSGSPPIPSEVPYFHGIRLVIGRELAAWFDGAVAAVALVVSLLAVGAMFVQEFFAAQRLDMAPFFDRLPLVLVLFAPAIAMRAWAEDRKQRTFELWMTLPLEPAQIVAGKYFASLALYGVFLAGTLPIPLMLVALGRPDPGPIVSGYVGAALLGALFLAIGQLLSSLTADQIVAFLASAFACACLVATGEPRVVDALDGLFPRVAPGTLLSDWVSALPRYEAFTRGVVGVSGLVYFAGASALVLAWSAAVVERRRS
ncbi:MAG TPA: ABC transporter permease [Planctomycetota bacterium]|nr:ABC transporter permease [Planctomycetota bacterium]